LRANNAAIPPSTTATNRIIRLLLRRISNYIRLRINRAAAFAPSVKFDL
jgi:hypothetical protein